MSENISPETAEHIRALCRQISVAHNLDEEIQRELYSHMEDKLLGYLSGAEKVTEEDAFILVREHFGDPEVIRGLLQKTHAVEVRVGMWKMIWSFLLAIWFISLFQYILQGIFLFVFINITPSIHKSDSVRVFMKLLLAGTEIASILFLWYILLQWRREIERGYQTWITRQKRFYFFIEVIPFWILAMVVLIIVEIAWNALNEHVQLSGLLTVQNETQTTKDIDVFLRHVKDGTGVMMNIALIWWMSWPFQGVKSLLKGIGSLVLMNGLAWAGFVLFIFIRWPEKVSELLQRDISPIIISVAVSIGIYLIWYAYRSILDRKLERIV